MIRGYAKFVMLFLLAAAAAPAGAQIGPGSIGKLLAFGDDWSTSDAAFTDDAASASQFARNIGEFLSPDRNGSFLVYRVNTIAYGPSFIDTLRDAGHTVTENPAGPVLVPDRLADFDAVFLAAQIGSGPQDHIVLGDYIRAGGSVMVSAGTGVGGNALIEAQRWSRLLNEFGLSFGQTWWGLPQGASLIEVPLVPSSSPLGQDVDAVRWNLGAEVSFDFSDPLNPAARIEILGDFTGLAVAPPGNVIGIAGSYITPTCGPADLVPPFGVLDLADVTTFTSGFLSMVDFTDFNDDGVLDLSDINLFIDSFLAGCP